MLVQNLFEGPVDIVGDVHGDIAGLRELLSHLGYHSEGGHPAGRRLVYVGDLVDRGPDSIAVLNFVQKQIGMGIAQAVLGNHELNLLLRERKYDNGWFFGKTIKDRNTGEKISQNLAKDDSVRDGILEFISTLPLALTRDDLRVVHACWQPEMVEMAGEATDILALYQQHQFNINLGLAMRDDLQPWQHELRLQNLNPVRVLSSGLEVKADRPFEASGRIRILKRYRWWEDYQDEAYCVFGHYSQPVEVRQSCQTRAICVDFGIGRRWIPKDPLDRSPEKWRLAALRFPELEFVFDNGERVEVVNLVKPNGGDE